jgi:hypothetical protein
MTVPVMTVPVLTVPVLTVPVLTVPVLSGHHFFTMLKQIRPLMLVWFGTLEYELHPVKPLIARLKSKVGNETSAKPNSW